MAEEKRIKQEKEDRARREAERLKEKQRLAEEKKLKQEQLARQKIEDQERILAEDKQRAQEELSRQRAQEELSQQRKQEALAQQRAQEALAQQRAQEELARQKAEQEYRIETSRLAEEKYSRQETARTPIEIKPVSKKLKYKVITRSDKPFIGRQKMNRTEYVVTVPSNYGADDIKAVCDQILAEEVRLNKDLDALWVSAYNEKSYRSKGTPRVYAIWSPPNGWDDFKNTTDKNTYVWDYRFLGR